MSGIPTLILAGALDPITPASYARATAATLDHAHVFEFAGISHGVLATEPCASELVAAFLAQPERRPEVTCPARDSEFSPSLNARAMALLEEGKAEEAEQLLRDLLAAQKALGPSHRNLAITLTSLGEVELRRGAYAEAEPLLKKALAVGSKTRSPYDPAIAAAALSLATVYRAQGRRDEAEPLYRRALRIEEIAWGPDHPRLLSTLEAYSDLLRELGRVREARELESRAAGIERG